MNESTTALEFGCSPTAPLVRKRNFALRATFTDLEKKNAYGFALSTHLSHFPPRQHPKMACQRFFGLLKTRAVRRRPISRVAGNSPTVCTHINSLRKTRHGANARNCHAAAQGDQ